MPFGVAPLNNAFKTYRIYLLADLPTNFAWKRSNIELDLTINKRQNYL